MDISSAQIVGVGVDVLVGGYIIPTEYNYCDIYACMRVATRRRPDKFAGFIKKSALEQYGSFTKWDIIFVRVSLYQSQSLHTWVTRVEAIRCSDTEQVCAEFLNSSEHTQVRPMQYSSMYGSLFGS